MIQLRCASPFQTGTSRTPLGISNHKAHIIRHLHKLWFHIKSGLAAARSPDYYDILVSGILWFLRSAVHGQTFRLCQQNIVLKDRINKRGYILFISPSGRTIFFSLAKLLSIFPLKYTTAHTLTAAIVPAARLFGCILGSNFLNANG